LLCLAIALPVGCTKSKVDRKDGREPAAKLVKTEPVRQETVHRAVEGDPLADITAIANRENVRWVMKAGQTVVDKTKR
jgi:hypothetical protein